MEPRPEARAARVAENESVFRQANEELVARLIELAPTLAVFPFICECGNAHCTHVLSLSLDEYQRIREYPARFLMVPGHEVAEDEHVVDRGRSYHVVEKTGEARDAVEQFDQSR